MAILDDAKLAMRITKTQYNAEITRLINAAKKDLGIAGVDYVDDTDPIVAQAIITYCRMHFGSPSSDEYADLKASYDEQKAQLQTASDYGGG